MNKQLSGIELTNNIGTNMFLIRTHLDITQAHMTKVLGISDTSIRKYERGASTPKIETIIAFCDEVNIPVDVLVRGSTKVYHLIGQFSNLTKSDQSLVTKLINRLTKLV